MGIYERLDAMYIVAKKAYDSAICTIDGTEWDDWPIENQLAYLDWYINTINSQMVKIRELMTQYKGLPFIQQVGQKKLDILNQYIQKLVRIYEKMTDYR